MRKLYLNHILFTYNRQSRSGNYTEINVKNVSWLSTSLNHTMKENKYDDQDFFDRYSKMPRSVGGLNSAEEWHELRDMLGELKGKRFLDLGCGYGWHCLYARSQGAERVTGVDISALMLERARQHTRDDAIAYLHQPIEDIEFRENEFDVVFSSLAFHYVHDLQSVFEKVHRCLSRDGEFVFSMEHPIYTALPQQDWYYDPDGNKLHWPVDNYQHEGSRRSNFMDSEVTKYHRTVATILNSVIQAGFSLERISEPQPSPEILEQLPRKKDDFRRPIFLMVKARKAKG